MTKASTDALSDLHAIVAKELKDRIESGEAKSADISNAIKFLKDNGIEADIETNKPLQGLAHQFPEFGDHPEDSNRVN